MGFIIFCTRWRSTARASSTAVPLAVNFYGKMTYILYTVLYSPKMITQQTSMNCAIYLQLLLPAYAYTSSMKIGEVVINEMM
jgi:hypothetical protein